MLRKMAFEVATFAGALGALASAAPAAPTQLTGAQVAQQPVDEVCWL